MSVLVSDDVSPENIYGLHKFNKCALKLLGIDPESHTDEEVLEFLSEFLTPTSITTLMFDSHNNFYILFLLDIESACKIVGKTLAFGDRKVKILPLLDFYVVYNVHPSVSNEDIADIFRYFGNVYEVRHHKLLPNSPKFSHVLSGKRELSFLLTGEDCDVGIPGNVKYLPFTFHVKKLCCACLTEGHSVLFCPDIEEGNIDKMSTNITEDDSDEISAIIAESSLMKEEVDIDKSEILEYVDTSLEKKSLVTSPQVEDLSILNMFNLHTEIDKALGNSEDILPKNVLKRLLLVDGRNKKYIKNFISQFSLNFKKVSEQLDKVNKRCTEKRILRKIKQLKNTIEKLT